MWKEHIESIIAGQGIVSHILDDPPSLDSDSSKPTDQYLSWGRMTA